jgi:hypothetical protein
VAVVEQVVLVLMVLVVHTAQAVLVDLELLQA